MRHETCYYLRRSQYPDKKENVDHIYDCDLMDLQKHIDLLGIWCYLISL